MPKYCHLKLISDTDGNLMVSLWFVALYTVYRLSISHGTVNLYCVEPLQLLAAKYLLVASSYSLSTRFCASSTPRLQRVNSAAFVIGCVCI